MNEWLIKKLGGHTICERNDLHREYAKQIHALHDDCDELKATLQGVKFKHIKDTHDMISTHKMELIHQIEPISKMIETKYKYYKTATIKRYIKDGRFKFKGQQYKITKVKR